MTLRLGFVLICLFVSSFALAEICNDGQALTYCKQTEGTYVAIVWPRGFDSLDYIVETLKKNAEIMYVKTFELNKKGLFLLYRCLHKGMSFSSAEKYFKPYIPTDIADQSMQVAAIVLRTDQSLDEMLDVKKQIRAAIGCSYYSIHINDFYYQTVEAARAVFNGAFLNLLNALPVKYKVKYLMHEAKRAG